MTSSTEIGRVETIVYVLMSTVPPPASMTMTVFPSCSKYISDKLGEVSLIMTNLYAFYDEVALNTEVQACFPFGDKVDASMPGCSVWDKPSHDRGLAHFALLKTLPAIGVGQDELDAIFDGSP